MLSAFHFDYCGLELNDVAVPLFVRSAAMLLLSVADLGRCCVSLPTVGETRARDQEAMHTR
jgi:hypothetical protein